MTDSKRQCRLDDTGASSVEYGLLIALIATVITVAVLALGGVAAETFSDTCTGIESGISATGQSVSASCT